MKRMLFTTRYCLLALVAMAFMASCASTRKSSSPHVYMSKQYEELKNVLNEAEVSIIKDSLKVIFPNNVLFASSSDQVNDAIKPTFSRFAEILNKYGKTKILITGHTDNTGSADYNRELSEKRAASAKGLLSSFNVNNDRMFTWGLSDRDPIASNNTDAGKARNRRVEFVILYDVKQ
ncbi:outer membrane protein OmpA-like peptidoglycan-associated protein [Chitinophaga polysaccharea]|uniref:Outer membrane protein OmpA-like peptidoglycan-associated protein n=1 Tax=Chitinophaga polysaccharea TaxID=1293035 RepID=A0A561PTA1_9BACT|nr:OmpA family protein [Chitinophaga polysaccharea]TWF41359.1 outer membrane protein OmpA-like peptidoglycan-associated protein [Chitinophaga polysaccharea]